MMKNVFLIGMIVFISCCGSRKTTETTSAPDAPADTLQAPVNSKPTPDTVVARPVLVPGCIDKLIETFKAEDVQNPPRKIFSYTYKDKTVYYVPAICCDFFSDLYDSNCNLIGHPDGGFTGKGDGKITDFEKEKKDEKLVWADPRKR